MLKIKVETSTLLNMESSCCWEKHMELVQSLLLTLSFFLNTYTPKTIASVLPRAVSCRTSSERGASLCLLAPMSPLGGCVGDTTRQHRSLGPFLFMVLKVKGAPLYGPRRAHTSCCSWTFLLTHLSDKDGRGWAEAEAQHGWSNQGHKSHSVETRYPWAHSLKNKIAFLILISASFN